MYQQPKKTIGDLFPGLDEKQLAEVEETLRHYAAIAWRVVERLEREEEEHKSKQKLELREPQENKDKAA